MQRDGIYNKVYSEVRKPIRDIRAATEVQMLTALGSAAIGDDVYLAVINRTEGIAIGVTAAVGYDDRSNWMVS